MVAKTIDDAVALSRELDGWNRIVTLEGELIVPSGAITGGSRKSKGPGLLVRKQEIDSLTAELTALDKDAAKLAKSAESAEQRLSDLTASITALEGELAQARTSNIELTNAAALRRPVESERFAKQLETAEIEKSEAELMLEDESKTAAELHQLLDTVGQENEDLDQKVAGAEQDIEALQQRRSQAREELMRLNVELAGSVERASAMRTSLDESRASLDRMTVDLAARRSAIGDASTGADALTAESDAVDGEIKLQRELLTAAEANLNTLSIERTTQHTSATHTETRLRDASAARNRLISRIA